LKKQPLKIFPFVSPTKKTVVQGSGHIYHENTFSSIDIAQFVKIKEKYEKNCKSSLNGGDPPILLKY